MLCHEKRIIFCNRIIHSIAVCCRDFLFQHRSLCAIAKYQNDASDYHKDCDLEVHNVLEISSLSLISIIL